MANPMYRQIAEDLRQRIVSGELAPGSQLPTELELRERFNASRNTVRDAIKWLTNLGLVATRPGQGTFVVEKIDPFVTKLSGNPKTGFGGGEGTSYLSEVSEGNRKPTTSRIRVEIQEAAPDIAEKLGKPAGSVVVSRHEKRYIDGTPWSLQTSFYPMEFVERGAVKLTHPDDIEPGTVHYLAERLGIHPERVSRLDRSACTGSQRDRLLQAARGRQDLDHPGVPDGVRRQRPAHAGYRHRLSRRPEPAHLGLRTGPGAGNGPGSRNIGESRASPSRSIKLTSGGGSSASPTEPPCYR